VTDTLATLDRAKYISLTTFRKTGVGVPTAVWFAIMGGSLVVITSATAGKVKRARNKGRAQFVRCSMTGRVASRAVPVDGTVEVLTEGDDAYPGAMAALRAKYGVQFRYAFGSESKPKGAPGTRVILRITPTGAPASA
jgi:PPOX class probable F420-dependent enzyme